MMLFLIGASLPIAVAQAWQDRRRTILSGGLVPGIEQGYTGRGEISYVAGDDRHPVNGRRRRDYGVALGSGIGNVQRVAASGDGQVYRENTLAEIDENAFLQLRAKRRSPGWITPLDP